MLRCHGFAISGCLCALCLLAMPVAADLIVPAITHVYFDKDGTPYNGSVQYSINCYGYTMSYPGITKPFGSYQPELVFHYSASCQKYGCSIYQPYYLRFTHIDWCDLEGDADNQTFAIRNFSSRPYSRCDFVPDRVEKKWGSTREYYYETPEYFSCRQFENNNTGTIWADRGSFTDIVPVNFTSILILQGRNPLYGTLPWSHLIINKTDISMGLDQYIEYLDTCDPTTDKKCPGWIIDGKPLKTFTEYRTLKNNATHLKEDPCDTFLVSADPSLIMPFTDEEPWLHPCGGTCNYTEMICDSRFTILSGNTTTWAEQNGSSIIGVPWAVITPDYTTVAIMPPSPQSTTTALPHINRSPIESLYCGILAFFGASC